MGLVVSILVPTVPAQAADARNFDPGYIIDDRLFYNGALMSEAQIQSFLEQQVPTCKATAGNPGCLKDYRTDSPPRLADKYCGLYQGGTNERASRVIYNIAQACNINPQVLLVTLQKEQGLITATNPSPTKYRIAMGYGCPDTAPCDTQYYGFFNQVYKAARQFNVYPANRDIFNYDSGVVNRIQWHPNGACGATDVFIQNDATAALYNYTPYRPNQAALSNLYGTGDACSSYGNRNFWRFFTDWFGSTTISNETVAFVKSVYVDVLGREPGDGEIGSWGRALMNGMPSGQVAGGFVNSDEFRLLKIDAAYRTVLNREPESAGRMSWLNGMRAGTLQPDDVERVFMDTDEYFNSTGGTTEAYVAAVYERIIKRPAAPEEVAYWVDMVSKHGRSTVVNLIWFSVETARARVAVMYELYLGRVADWGGLVQWGDYALRHGDSATRSALIGSSEYWVRSSIRYP